MPRKQKAKTKKQLKKSVNCLYKALMAEKEKHRKASKMVGYLKQALESSATLTQKIGFDVIRHIRQEKILEKNNEHTLDVSAALIKRITQD